MSSPVGIEREPEHPLARMTSPIPRKLPSGSFLVGRRTSSNAHWWSSMGDDEVPLLSGDPLMGASVLVEDHAGPRGPSPVACGGCPPGAFLITWPPGDGS